jgi:hypothetical protein
VEEFRGSGCIITQLSVRSRCERALVSTGNKCSFTNTPQVHRTNLKPTSQSKDGEFDCCNVAGCWLCQNPFFEKLGFSSYHDASEKLQKQHFFQYRLSDLLQMAFDNQLSHAKQERSRCALIRSYMRSHTHRLRKLAFARA